MSFVRFTVNSDKFRAAIAKSAEAVHKEMVKTAEVIGLRFVREFRSTRLNGRPGLISHTGETSASLGHHVIDDDGKTGVLVAFQGAAARHVGLQERGGIVIANGKATKCGKGRMLAIPLPAARTASGFLRAGPCGVKGLKLVRSKKGNLLLVKFEGRGKGRTMTPMFVLKKSVRIPPRLGFFKSWELFLPTAKARITEGVRRAIVAAGL